VQGIDHLHVKAIVGHGDVAVFGLDEVDADDARVGGGEFEAEQDLCEDAVGRHGAEHLVEIPNLNRAGGLGVWLAALFEFIPFALRPIEVSADRGNCAAQAGIEQELAVFSEVGVVADFFGESGPVCPLVRSVHDFEVLLVLGPGASGDLVEPFAEMGMAGSFKPLEGVEELIVAGLSGDGNESSHRKRVDELVVKMLVFVHGVGADLAFSADRLGRKAAGLSHGLGKSEGDGIDAEPVLGGIVDEGLGVDASAEMVVEVSALGHCIEEASQGDWTGFGCFVEGTGGAELGGGV